MPLACLTFILRPTVLSLGTLSTRHGLTASAPVRGGGKAGKSRASSPKSNTTGGMQRTIGRCYRAAACPQQLPWCCYTSDCGHFRMEWAARALQNSTRMRYSTTTQPHMCAFSMLCGLPDNRASPALSWEAGRHWGEAHQALSQLGSIYLTFIAGGRPMGGRPCNANTISDDA